MTTLTIGTLTKKSDLRRPAAFTLVELILVMALLAIILGFAAPSLARSMRQRHLDQEAARLLALTEYARDEAVSQGIPMTVWTDGEGRRFGAGPKTGFTGDPGRAKEFALDPDIQVDPMKGTVAENNTLDIAEFSPDGTMAITSVVSIRLFDRFNSAVLIAQTEDAWGYEIVKEVAP